ncbi:MAG: hypothetical protein KGJ06_05535, partial [Pseudomonadota bacterium]|nr:hypothetical protein [Pseudomonadota bacterium]
MTHPIVASARGWTGTRFHHQGRLKKTASHKGGVDCLGLLAGVAGELNLRDHNGEELAAFDEIDYSHRPDASKLRAKLAELLLRVPVQEISPGDIALLRIDGSPQHLAIISDFGGGLGMI